MEMDELWIRSKLQIAKDDDWHGLTINEQLKWLAFARRRRQQISSLPKEISEEARDHDLSINQVMYVAMLRLAQYL